MAGPIDPRLVRRGRATRNFLVALAVVGVVSSVAIIVQASVVAEAVTTVFATHSLDRVPGWVAALAAVFVVRAALAWLDEWLAQRASAQVKSELRRDLLAARLARPADSSVSSSTLVQLVTTGLDALDGYYSKYLPQLVLASIVPVVVGVTIARADLLSAVIIAVTIPLIPVFMALVGWTTQAQVARRWKVQMRLANHFADLVTGLPTLQVFGRARAQRRGLEASERGNRIETNKTLRVSFLSSLSLELLATLSVAVVAVTVGFRLVAGGIDFPTALFVLVLAPEAYTPVRLVGSHFHDAADGMEAAERALSIIEGASSHVTAPDAPDEGLLLQLDDVTFTHPGAASPVLEHFSLAVAPGEVVALTGPSGGGKSTALSIAMGWSVPDLGRAAVVRPVAWVGQNPGMLRGTVRGNLLLGSATASEDACLQAMADAGASGIGLDHEVFDDAHGLSAGERRRVAIARALLAIRFEDARLLVLDEPTAGLDADTEASVLQAVRDSGAGALVVSHRPAVLAAADRVVTLGSLTVERDGSSSDLDPIPSVSETENNAPDPSASTLNDPVDHPPVGSVRELFVQLLRTTHHGRRKLFWTVFFAASASGASVALMAVSAWLISRAAEHPPVLYLQAAAVSVRFFGILRGVARYCERLVGHDLALAMQGTLRLRTYEALSRTTLLGRSRGDLLTRAVRDVDAIQDLVVRVLAPLLSAGVVMLATSAVLAFFEPVSASILLGTALFAGFVVPWAAQRASRRADRTIAPARAELATATDELSHVACELVVHGAVESHLDRVLTIDTELRAAEARSASIRGIAAAGQTLAAGAAVLGGLWWGSQAVSEQEMLGRCLAILVLVPLALHEVFAAFAKATQTWTQARSSLSRVISLLDEEPVGTGDRPSLPPSDDPGISLDGLTVGWPGHGAVAEGIELDVTPGERVALVGPSGIGKTTVLATVMGLIPPLEGTSHVRGEVGYLAQDAHIFATSIAENVRIGNKDATDEQVLRALRLAGLGIDPQRVVGEQGATLSGGEVRRLALARLLVRGRAPQVLLLDEPTEHLDQMTAQALMADLWRVCSSSAVLVVTHDADVMAACDRTIRLQGRGVASPRTTPRS